MAVIKGGKPLEGYKSEVVGIGVNQEMDSVPITQATTYEWLLSIEDNVNNKFSSSKIHATHRQSLNPDWSHGHWTGDKISITVTILLNAGVVSLYIQNDEGNALTVKVRRILI